MTNLVFAVLLFILLSFAVFSSYFKPFRKIVLLKKVSLSDLILWSVALVCVAISTIWFRSSTPMALNRWMIMSAIVLVLFTIIHFAFDYLDNYPNKFLTLRPDVVYFLDEKISHYLVYTALAVFICFIPFSRLGIQGGQTLTSAFVILGVLFGIPIGISLVEGQSPYLWIPLSFASVGVLVLMAGVYEYDSQIFSLVLSMLVSSVTVILVYGLVFSGFKEPSEKLKLSGNSDK